MRTAPLLHGAGTGFSQRFFRDAFLAVFRTGFFLATLLAAFFGAFRAVFRTGFFVAFFGVFLAGFFFVTFFLATFFEALRAVFRTGYFLAGFLTTFFEAGTPPVIFATLRS